MTDKTSYVHIDLFSGIGGFALGFQKAGLNFKEHFFSEIDKNAINIYKNHFPEAKELGDVTTIRDFSDLRRACAGKIVIITFGFPCQDLSVAGKGAGLAGARSGLFFEAIRIVKELNPQYFIFENVKGLLTNNRGADFVRCLREIADIGLYDCEWQLVNTSWFLPQNRERIYFVGHLRGKSQPKVFPIKDSNSNFAWLQGQNAKCLTTKGTHTNGTYVVERKQLQKIGKDGKLKSNQHLASCLTGGGHSGGNHSDMDLIFQTKRGILMVPENTKKGFVEVHPEQGVDLTQLSSKTRRGRLMAKNCNTLTTQTCQYAWWDGATIRRLTPLECERLQGFPDGWTEYGADGKKISDSARYKALGNAVSVPVPEIIGKRIAMAK